jgi:ryanodine receptor 2
MNQPHGEPGRADLDRKYRDCVSQCEYESARWKRRYQRAWLAGATLTWLTLLLAIAGQTLVYGRDLSDLMLRILIPVFGCTVTLLTVYQLAAAPQQRWLRYREAVHNLWNACILFRAKLPPFAGPGAPAVLEDRIDQIRGAVEGGSRRSLREWFRRLPEIYSLPAVPAGKYDHLPEQGLEPSLDADPTPYLDGRLRSQRQWYLRKARLCRFQDLLLLSLVGIISLFNSVWIGLHGRAFWLVAGATALNLMLFAWRDFLGCGALWVQYRQAAVTLTDLENAFLRRERPFDAQDPRKRLQRLIEQVEHALTTEFHYWFAIRQQHPAEHPTPAVPAYEPRPIATETVELSKDLLDLTEQLASNTHDEWARQRLAEGWQYGPERNDTKREHPCLVPYQELPEGEKEYDRLVSMGTLKLILALNYRIEKRDGHESR